MIVVYILLILLLIILFTPVGIHGQYNGESYFIAARVLFFDIKLISSEDEEAKEEKAKKSKAKKNKKTNVKQKPNQGEKISAEQKPDQDVRISTGQQYDDKNQGGESDEEVNLTSKKSKQKPDLELNEIIDLLYLGIETLGKFKRKLLVNKFKFHFVSASEDPYDTVIYFNLVTMILEALKGFSKKSCKLCSTDVETGMDFEASEPRVDVDIILTINLIRILAVLIFAGRGFLKIRKSYKNKQNMNNEGAVNYG